MLMTAFAPDLADMAIEHMEDLIAYMTNDILHPKFMKTMHEVDMMIVKIDGIISKMGKQPSDNAHHHL